MHIHRSMHSCQRPLKTHIWTIRWGARKYVLEQLCCSDGFTFFYFSFATSKVRILDYHRGFNDPCSMALPSVYEVQSSFCGHAWKAVASVLNEVRCVSAYTSCLWSSGHPTPNLIPNLQKLLPLPLGKVTGQESFMQDTNKSRLRPLKNLPRNGVCPWRVCFCQRSISKNKLQFAEYADEFKKRRKYFVIHQWMLIYICPHYPVTKTSKTECGRVSRTMQARVHLSPYVNRAGRGSHILASLKSLFHQTWVNRLMMDMQKQVLFLLAGALDKKPVHSELSFFKKKKRILFNLDN